VLQKVATQNDKTIERSIHFQVPLVLSIQVGTAYDYHFDFQTDLDARGVYTTHHVTTAVQNWISKQIGHSNAAKTFAYVAHEAVHGPLEVPYSYIEGPCEQLVPADHPSRRVYCGMVRAADESLRNISETYQQLGIWEQTVVILSADNGGNVNDGEPDKMLTEQVLGHHRSHLLSQTTCSPMLRWEQLPVAWEQSHGLGGTTCEDFAYPPTLAGLLPCVMRVLKLFARCSIGRSKRDRPGKWCRDFP
jgi:hypothetical protein